MKKYRIVTYKIEAFGEPSENKEKLENLAERMQQHEERADTIYKVEVYHEG